MKGLTFDWAQYFGQEYELSPSLGVLQDLTAPNI